ncbi:MAG: hypothetical protein FI695_02265 [SAR202 cluster bacterium]|nr:hypothetical protein [Chloroflexota bacterium]MQG50788.1 hypothetical protein [SAR202 cluster bacterium]|tara:strand:+ start:1 stop:819 length:819 start_codon:yes stop_codon:yes gene_type:complete
MNRKQLFEFEDFHWFPNWIRIATTNLLAVLQRFLGIKEILLDLIIDFKNMNDIDQIIDIGSGSGGVMINVIDELNSRTKTKKVKLLLTDLYPDEKVVNKINNQNNPYIEYHREKLDAENLYQTPKGLKTLINCFHHINPSKATKLLKSCQENNETILIYEMGTNFLPFIVWLLILPLSLSVNFISALILTPFCKSLTFRQLIFTYLIPIIPVCYAWDGQASLARIYTEQDIKSLLIALEKSSYNWTIKPGISKNGKKLGYCIIGYPLASGDH